MLICAENVNNEGLDNIKFFWPSLGQTGNWGKWHSENSPGRTQTHDATAVMRRLLTQACYSCARVICVCTERLRAENSFYSYLRGRLDREDRLWPEVPGERHGWGSPLQGKTKQIGSTEHPKQQEVSSPQLIIWSVFFFIINHLLICSHANIYTIGRVEMLIKSFKFSSRLWPISRLLKM